MTPHVSRVLTRRGISVAGSNVGGAAATVLLQLSIDRLGTSKTLVVFACVDVSKVLGRILEIARVDVPAGT